VNQVAADGAQIQTRPRFSSLPQSSTEDDDGSHSNLSSVWNRPGRRAFAVHGGLQRLLESDRSVGHIHQAAAGGRANGNRAATGDLRAATLAATAARGIWSAADDSSGAIAAPATGLSRGGWVFNAQVITRRRQPSRADAPVLEFASTAQRATLCTSTLRSS